MRLKKAEDLLLHTDMSIEQISASVGYINVSSFRRKFKQEIGMTPLLSVRERNRKEREIFNYPLSFIRSSPFPSYLQQPHTILHCPWESVSVYQNPRVLSHIAYYARHTIPSYQAETIHNSL